jgi:hypothetical protein
MKVRQFSKASSPAAASSVEMVLFSPKHIYGALQHKHMYGTLQNTPEQHAPVAELRVVALQQRLLLHAVARLKLLQCALDHSLVQISRQQTHSILEGYTCWSLLAAALLASATSSCCC